MTSKRRDKIRSRRIARRRGYAKVVIGYGNRVTGRRVGTN